MVDIVFFIFVLDLFLDCDVGEIRVFGMNFDVCDLICFGKFDMGLCFIGVGGFVYVVIVVCGYVLN